MSVIYKIYCLDENIKDCYIGSTNDLTDRKQKHKKNCNKIDNNNKYNYKVYKFIRGNGGFENWEFEILETFNTIDKQDLHKIERKYIESNNSTLNTYIPTRTKQEFKEYQKEYQKKNQKEYQKEYYAKNKEKKNEKVICEFCKALTTKPHLNRHQRNNNCKSFQK